MKTVTRKAKNTAVGTVNKGKRGYGVYFRDTSVRLDTETFEEIRQIAIKRKWSFGAVIRSLVEIGLETEKLEQADSTGKGAA